jgi:hypothetical protein
MLTFDAMRNCKDLTSNAFSHALFSVQFLSSAFFLYYGYAIAEKRGVGLSGPHDLFWYLLLKATLCTRMHTKYTHAPFAGGCAPCVSVKVLVRSFLRGQQLCHLAHTQFTSRATSKVTLHGYVLEGCHR